MKTLTSASLIGAFALTAALTGCSSPEEPTSETSPEQAEAGEEVSAEYNDADVEYISGMIAHHQQAFEMSGTVLEKDEVEPEVAVLAGDIREAQGPEIQQMESWLDSWGASDRRDMEDMDHGDMGDGQMEHEGMMSEEELADLEESTGTEASRMFLEQMIVHHAGAVSSAEQHLQEGENSEALELSESIIADQQAEIDHMEELLANF
ncbi:DUF305 domain-containing protein [Nesterenkonia sp. HG001]|uniref:DUF305 domain-containing protein n=1 Tax=Nesterenkonia sp. HG001 TaxID=2983207 RepID=UPI002AC4CEF4|nr:DUF305 domain-containing protein [Nesterenkonia sp. HG001]MDZ5077827.1 DUF305 domain-containing protein [Nesterenkonia sp. HG001]